MKTVKFVKIEIPMELKKSFFRERQLEHIKFGDMYKSNIQDGIEKNDVVKVSNGIYSVRHRLLRRTGFYKNFPEWLDFALMSLMDARGIPVRNKWERADVYSSLGKVNEELKDWDRFDFDILVERACYMTHKVKDGMHYNPNIDEMCRLFVEIGLDLVDPYQLADLSYRAFLRVSHEDSPVECINKKVRVRKYN